MKLSAAKFVMKSNVLHLWHINDSLFLIFDKELTAEHGIKTSIDKSATTFLSSQTIIPPKNSRRSDVDCLAESNNFGSPRKKIVISDNSR
jgi:hypothetical protein